MARMLELRVRCVAALVVVGLTACAEVTVPVTVDRGADAEVLAGTAGDPQTTRLGDAWSPPTDMADAGVGDAGSAPPSEAPSGAPSEAPSGAPSEAPSGAPSEAPSGPPTAPPTAAPAPETCNGQDDDGDAQIDELAGCPCDLLARNGRAYLLCREGRPWAGAQDFCESVGYTLVSVDDAGEDGFIYGEMRARGLGDTWIGLSDQAAEGQWVWTDGNAPVYAHWDQGEPNDGGRNGEDCALIMTAENRTSEWDDRPCEGARPFVCEAGP
jgi:CD209 antigen